MCSVQVPIKILTFNIPPAPRQGAATTTTRTSYSYSIRTYTQQPSKYLCFLGLYYGPGVPVPGTVLWPVEL